MNVEQYVFGFMSSRGTPYDYHISDDLKSGRTWEAINIKFSLPNSQYVFVWRRDKEEFKEYEVKYLAKYLSDDMRDFMDESRKSNASHAKLLYKWRPSKKCIVFAYDDMGIPSPFLHPKYELTDVSTEMIWDYLERSAYDGVTKMSKTALEEKNDSENIENILDPDIDILAYLKRD